MQTITAPPVPVSQVGRATHDIGLAGWAGARADEAAPSRLSAAERRLALAKDVLVGYGAGGVERQRRTKRRLNVLGSAALDLAVRPCPSR